MGIGFLQQFESLVILLFALVLEIIFTYDELSRDLLFTCSLVSFSPSEHRKEIKAATKIQVQKTFQILLHLFCSQVAFFHIVIIMALLDFYWGITISILRVPFGFVLGYFFLFFVVQCAKALLRTKNIYYRYIKSQSNSFNSTVH